MTRRLTRHPVRQVPGRDLGGRAQGFDGTWVMCKDRHSDKVMPIYSEPQLVCAPWKLTDEKFPEKNSQKSDYRSQKSDYRRKRHDKAP